MKAIVLNCIQGSRFHFGKYAPDGDTALSDSDEILHSDTLFSALINTYQELTGDADPLVNYFRQGAIKISSLYFCFEQNNKYTWLLPKPITFNLEETIDFKKLKSIRYITKSVWEKLINPSHLLTESADYSLAWNNHIALCSDDLSFPESIQEDKKLEALKMICPINILTLPKVRVRDLEENKTTYQISVTEIANNEKWLKGLNVHFYFLIDFEGEHALEAEKMLMDAINLLVLNGIGGERNTMGALESFTIIEDWQIEMEEKSTTHAATVSLVNPALDSDLSNSYYRFLLRGGRRLGRDIDANSTSSSSLKSIRLITEGAVLKLNTQGSLVNISPNDKGKFLRNGMPLYLPVKKQWIKAYE
jgi:CRISPR-associated protein Csm4